MVPRGQGNCPMPATGGIEEVAGNPEGIRARLGLHGPKRAY
jgi:hypothetical protein